MEAHTAMRAKESFDLRVDPVDMQLKNRSGFKHLATLITNILIWQDFLRLFFLLMSLLLYIFRSNQFSKNRKVGILFGIWRSLVDISHVFFVDCLEIKTNVAVRTKEPLDLGVDTFNVSLYAGSVLKYL